MLIIPICEQTHGPDGKSKFDLRYYVCADQHRPANGSEPAGPIFFYLGNESDVLLYLNATGLMWENAAEFGAMLIFAEHRYYGESLPFGKHTYKHMAWLSSEQALADYASLLFDFKREEGLEEVPVIGFGGSYGGMLATWGRQKYPHVWEGAIAGSAPIWTFVGEHPPMDPLFYAKTVTYDTSVAAGAPEGCTDTLRAAFNVLTSTIKRRKAGGADAASRSAAGRRAGPRTAHRPALELDAITEALNICPSNELNTTDDVYAVRDWAASAFDMMAMGNYPYPSSYMLNGNGMLPAFPMREACSKALGELRAAPTLSEFDDGSSQQTTGASVEGVAGKNVLAGLAEAIGIWYNYTGDVACFNPWEGVNELTALVADLWDYQYCTEQWMPMSKNGVDDIYWDEPFDKKAMIKSCEDTWGVTPRPTWGTIQWGGKDLQTLTNVVFSNGLYDPWHLGGVLEDLSDSVRAVIIPEGGHHLDLFFANDADPASVTEARRVEVDNMHKWVSGYHARRRARAEQEVAYAGVRSAEL